MAILLVALIVRVGVVIGTHGYAPVTDDKDYDRHALSIARGHGYPNTVIAAPGPSAFRPPAFPYLLAGVYALAGTHSPSLRWTAARLGEAVLGTITVALIALLALRLWGPRAALVAGAFAAVYPPLIVLSASLLSESVFVPLELAAVLAALEMRRSGRLRLGLATGGLVGAAALTRANGILLIVPLILLAWTGRPWWRPRSLVGPGAVVVAAVLALVPWTVRNERVMHAFIPLGTQDGYALAGTYNEVSDRDHAYPAAWRVPLLVPRFKNLLTRSGLGEAAASSRLKTAAENYVVDHPGYPLKVAYYDTLRLLDLRDYSLDREQYADLGMSPKLALAGRLGFFLLLPLAALGVAVGAFRRAPVWFWLAPALVFISTLLVSASTRYRAPVDPFLILLGAAGVSAVWERRTARRG